MSRIRAFTLIELLIVIAIIATLGSATVVVLNPTELVAQSRDSQRITDIKTIRDAINLWKIDNPSATMGTSQTVYISIPDISTTCANTTGLPVLPTGWSYGCVTQANLHNTNGTGWIPLDFRNINSGPLLSSLPTDPVNDISVGKYYSYILGTTYELNALLESSKSKENKVAQLDGGDDPYIYEAGGDVPQMMIEKLNNPVWDTGTFSGWSVSAQGGSIVSSPSHYGVKSAVIQGSNSYCNNYFIQDIPVTPNTVYSIGAWIKTVNEPGSAFVGIADTSWGNWTESSRLTGNSDWTYKSVQKNSGALITMRFFLSVGWCGGPTPGNGPSGTTYFSTPSVVTGTILFNK